MKKISTVAAEQIRNFSEQKLTTRLCPWVKIGTANSGMGV